MRSHMYWIHLSAAWRITPGGVSARWASVCLFRRSLQLRGICNWAAVKWWKMPGDNGGRGRRYCHSYCRLARWKSNEIREFCLGPRLSRPNAWLFAEAGSRKDVEVHRLKSVAGEVDSVKCSRRAKPKEIKMNVRWLVTVDIQVPISS